MADFPQFDSLFSSSASPDLAAIAVMLARTARALAAGGTTAEPEPAPKDETGLKDDICCQPFSRPARGREPELFEDQGAENLQAVLFNAFSAISGLACLLEQIDAEAELPGVTMHMLARELKRVENLFFKIQDACSTLERVQADACASTPQSQARSLARNGGRLRPPRPLHRPGSRGRCVRRSPGRSSRKISALCGHFPAKAAAALKKP